jgi:predicted GIY-YIG superfamily endonuclease
MPFTYSLRCADGSYYVGSTRGDLGTRVDQHNLGTGSRYTACRRPVELLWYAEFDRVTEAFAFEKQVQNWSRAKREALIEGRYDDLPALSRSSCRRSCGLDRLDHPSTDIGLDR